MLSSTSRPVNGRNNSRRWLSKQHTRIVERVGFTNIPSATPVPFGRGRGKPVNVPDHPPPPGYLCYRCREKGTFPRTSEVNKTNLSTGHWIQACPTNNDPKFDGKYRVKRSTGIPRSLQTKVEKPESLAPDGSADDARNTGVMVNADGDFVIAKPDKAAWELYQEKAKASAAAAAEAAAAEESKALQAWGLECPIDKRMFLEPTKTPCCQRTYCNDCISNALIESDFVCPGCATEGVLLDNLVLDEEAVSKIKSYEAKKAEEKKEKEKQTTGQDDKLVTNGSTEQQQPTQRTSKEPSPTRRSPSQQEAENVPSPSRKRPLEEETVPEEDGDSLGNVAKKPKGEDQPEPPSTGSEFKDGTNNPAMSFNPQMPFGGFGMMPPFSEGFNPNDPMSFMNPMAMANGFPGGMGQGWNPMNMPFNPLQSGMYGGQPNGFPNMFNGDPSMGMFPMGQMGPSMQNPGFQGPGMNAFSNQQRTAFSGSNAREEDSPYLRQPVNPQRHQARHRRVRPSDYREL